MGLGIRGGKKTGTFQLLHRLIRFILLFKQNSKLVVSFGKIRVQLQRFSKKDFRLLRAVGLYQQDAQV